MTASGDSSISHLSFSVGWYQKPLFVLARYIGCPSRYVAPVRRTFRDGGTALGSAFLAVVVLCSATIVALGQTQFPDFVASHRGSVRTLDLQPEPMGTTLASGEQPADNISLVGRWFDGSCSAVSFDPETNLAYVSNGPGILTVDMSDPDSLRIVGRWLGADLGNVMDIASSRELGLESDLLYAVDEGGNFYVLVAGSGGQLREVSRTKIDVGATQIVFWKNHAYVPSAFGTLSIIDLSNAAEPKVVVHYQFWGNSIKKVATSANYLLIVGTRTDTLGRSGYGLWSYKLLGNGFPREAGFTAIPGVAKGIAVHRDFAYVISSNGFCVVDLSDPSRLQVTSLYHSAEFLDITGAVATGNRLYVVGTVGVPWQGRLGVFDISDPDEPRELGAVQLPRPPATVKVSADDAFVCARTDFYVVDISVPERPELGSTLDVWKGPGTTELEVGDGLAYCAGALGIRVFDITRPSQISLIGFVPCNTHPVALDVRRHYVFTTTTPANLRILDTSNPHMVSVAGTWSAGSGAIDALTLSGKCLLVHVAGSGLHIVDVSDPANPHEVGYWAHDGGAADLAVDSGGYVYVSSPGEHRVWVVDVSDPTAPRDLAYWETGGLEIPIRTLPIGNYLIVMLSGEFNVAILDVSLHDEPEEIIRFQAAGVSGLSATHGMVFLTTFWGILVLDLTQPSSPMVMAFFPTHRRLVSIDTTDGLVFAGDNSGGMWVFRMSTTPELQHSFALVRAYPNPFNRSTDICFEVNQEGPVRIEIYDVRGRLVKTVYRDYTFRGVNQIRWDGADETGASVPSGVYICRVTAAAVYREYWAGRESIVQAPWQELGVIKVTLRR